MKQAWAIVVGFLLAAALAAAQTHTVLTNDQNFTAANGRSITGTYECSGAGTISGCAITGGSGSFSGNATTATALASAPTKCSANQATIGIDTSGNAQGCFSPITLPGGSSTQLQYNNAGVFGGIAGSSFSGGTVTLDNVANAASPLVLKDNGVAVYTFADVVGTALNGLTFTGAATGTGSTIASSGGDTNIELALNVKGTANATTNAAKFVVGTAQHGVLLTTGNELTSGFGIVSANQPCLYTSGSCVWRNNSTTSVGFNNGSSSINLNAVNGGEATILLVSSSSGSASPPAVVYNASGGTTWVAGLDMSGTGSGAFTRPFEFCGARNGNGFDATCKDVSSLIIGQVLSQTNGITITPTATGGAPSVNATGSDTNIDAGFNAKGSGFVTHNAPVVLGSYAVAALPTCGTTRKGARATVTDANAACVFVAAPAGGGTTVCPVYCDGTNWLEG